MSAIVEIIQFAASEGRDDRTALRPLFDTSGNAEEHLKVFHGVQVEDKTIGYLVLVWDSEEASSKWTGRSDFEEKSKSIIGQPTSNLKVQFEFIVADVFEAPVTEFALAKFKNESFREEFDTLTDGLVKMLSSKEKGGYAPTFGPVKEGGEADVAIIIGWDSPEAHMNAVKDEPGVAKLFELADLTVVHATFTKLL